MLPQPQPLLPQPQPLLQPPHPPQQKMRIMRIIIQKQPLLLLQNIRKTPRFLLWKTDPVGVRLLASQLAYSM